MATHSANIKELRIVSITGGVLGLLLLCHAGPKSMEEQRDES